MSGIDNITREKLVHTWVAAAKFDYQGQRHWRVFDLYGGVVLPHVILVDNEVEVVPPQIAALRYIF